MSKYCKFPLWDQKWVNNVLITISFMSYKNSQVNEGKINCNCRAVCCWVFVAGAKSNIIFLKYNSEELYPRVIQNQKLLEKLLSNFLI